MKILVAVKRVIDPYVKIRVKSNETGVETERVKMSINPFDDIALEEAIRLREQHLASEVVAVTVGQANSEETLRHALALGADRAILVITESTHCSLNIAYILKAIVAQVEPDLVMMGKQSIDGDNNQTPQMLAALLNWPQATNASSIRLNDNILHVTREIDSGLETLSMPLPAVLSADLRLNEPRYTSLQNIMKSRQKHLEKIPLEQLSCELIEHCQTLSVKAPLRRVAGVRLDSVNELVDKLQHEAKVL